MKHLKKFESTNNKNFDISEVSDIIKKLIIKYYNFFGFFFTTTFIYLLIVEI